MPWLDLGDLPVSYNTHKTEAFQVFMIPTSSLPENLVVPYENWSGRFPSKNVVKNFEKTSFAQHGIELKDIEETLQRATELIKNYRGKLAARNRIIKIGLAIAGLIFFVIAIIIGMTDHGNYWAPMILCVVYLLSFLIVITIFKYRSSY